VVVPVDNKEVVEVVLEDLDLLFQVEQKYF
jgi:hypothetical protein